MKKYDVLLLIALAEEMKAFEQFSFFELGKPFKSGQFNCYEFIFIDKTQKKRTGALLVVNGMASKMRDAVITFCKDYKTKLAINAGISGRLSADAKIGDVVLASYVNLYAERSAYVSRDGTFSLQPGGAPVPIDLKLRNAISESRFVNSLKFLDFEVFCELNKIELDDRELGQCRRWVDDEIVAGTPSIVEGPFASGPSVGKAEEFKTWIKGLDKNYLAVDMESGYAADAISSLNENEQPNFLSIRAISDPGNITKPDFDAIGPEAFRGWAMQNIIIALTGFLTTEANFVGYNLVPVEEPMSPKPLPVSSQDNIYPGQVISMTAGTEAKNRRFSNLRKDTGKNQQEVCAYEKFIHTLAEAEDGAMFLVEGAGGCGKSSLMRFVEEELNKRPDDHVAKFIDIRDLYINLPDIQHEEFAKAFFRDSLDLENEKSNRIVVLVDELFGHPREKILLGVLQSLLSEYSNKVVLAFGFDHYETSKTTLNSPTSPFLYNLTYTAEFRLKNTNIDDDEKALPLIQGLLETSSESKVFPEPSMLLEKIRSLNFPYLNAFVVSLLLANEKKKLFRSCSTSTEFVLFAMQDELEARQRKTAFAVSFDDICIEALRVHTPELHLSNISKKRSAIREYYDNNFAQFPKLVQTSLIANAVAILMSYPPDGSQKLFDLYEIDSEKFYSIVFGCDVTASIKDLLNDPQREEALLNSALAICARVDGPSLSFALYLAGRAVSPNGKRIAKGIFDRTKELLYEPTHGHNGIDIRSISQVSKVDKFYRLATRTHFISAAYSGDVDATDDYIRRVLSDPVEESLNRTFHLEYYGDHPAKEFKSTSISVELNLEDNYENWKRTRGVLLKRINAAIGRDLFSQIDRVHVLTYFCTIRSKHERGSLEEAEISEAKSLIGQLERFNFTLGEELSRYLNMLEYALEKPIFNFIDVLVQLYKLKSTPRFGWQSRKFGGSGEGMESVASHVMGVMLLADLLVPELFPQISESDQSRIKDMILTHDIGESLVGDFHPSDQNKRIAEKEAIMLLDAMSIYGDFSNLRKYKDRFLEFSEANSFISKIANSFDKLDSIIQAYIYHDHFETEEDFREFMADNLNHISEPKIKRLGMDVIAKADFVI